MPYTENFKNSDEPNRLKETGKAVERIIRLPVRGGPGCCPICGRRFKQGEWATIRELWIRRGGFGSIPPEAVVHIMCDKNEIRRMSLTPMKGKPPWINNKFKRQ